MGSKKKKSKSETQSKKVFVRAWGWGNKKEVGKKTQTFQLKDK